MAIVKEEILKKLRSTFNLNIYEVKVWVALISKGVATAGELSDMSNVPRSRAYDVLESLEKKGFIVMKIGRPIKYLAVKPEEVIKRVKNGLQKRAEEEIKMVENVRGTDAFDELILLHKHGVENIDPANISGALKGRSNIYNHILNIVSEAKNSVIISTTDKGLVRKAEYLKSALKKLKQSKVDVRIAAPLKDEEAKKTALELKDIAKVKSCDVNARFVLIDGKDVFFMVRNDSDIHESSDLGIWVNTPYFSSALEQMFNNAWRC